MAAAGLKITLFGNAAGTSTMNVLHLANDYPQTQWAALANEFDQEFIRKINFAQSSSFLWTGVNIRPLDPPNASGETFPLNRPGAAASLLPMQLALVINMRTNAAGRSFRGRFFLSGLQTGANSLGVPSSGTLLSMQTGLTSIFNYWCGGSGLNDHHLAVYSRKLDLLQFITSLSCRPTFGTIRGRRLGVGM